MGTRSSIFTIPFVILVLALTTGFALVWRLFVLAVLVILVSYLWSLLNARGIRAEVSKVPGRFQVGDAFTEEVTFINTTRLPRVWLKGQENTDLPGYHNVNAFSLSPGGRYHEQSTVHCRRRGQYSLGTFTLTAGDPFGLFSQQRVLGEQQNIIVCPATVALPFFSLAQTDSSHGSNPWLGHQAGPTVGGIREAITGDSLNHIHWQSTAHMGKLMVKTFDPDRFRNAARVLWIVLDMHQEAHRGDGEHATAEYGVAIAASLLKKHIEVGWTAGLVASGDQTHCFRPETGEAHLWRLLTALALVKATGNIPIDQLIMNESLHFGRDAAVIVITADGEGLATSLRKIRSQGNMVAGILLDAASFDANRETVNTGPLSLGGAQVYIVRRGADLAEVLDTREFSRQASGARV